MEVSKEWYKNHYEFLCRQQERFAKELYEAVLEYPADEIKIRDLLDELRDIERHKHSCEFYIRRCKMLF